MKLLHVLLVGICLVAPASTRRYSFPVSLPAFFPRSTRSTYEKHLLAQTSSLEQTIRKLQEERRVLRQRLESGPKLLVVHDQEETRRLEQKIWSLEATAARLEHVKQQLERDLQKYKNQVEALEAKLESSAKIASSRLEKELERLRSDYETKLEQREKELESLMEKRIDDALEKERKKFKKEAEKAEKKAQLELEKIVSEERKKAEEAVGMERAKMRKLVRALKADEKVLPSSSSSPSSSNHRPRKSKTKQKLGSVVSQDL